MKEQYLEIVPGWLYQNGITEQPVQYNSDYVKKYNSYPLAECLSRLRLDWVKKHTEGVNSVLDVGYGSGSFLYECHRSGLKCFGYDVSGYALDSRVTIVDSANHPADIVTWFDSLEHIPSRDLVSILKPLSCKYLAISVPWCHWTQDMRQFEGWKHRKPNEHFHHFDTHGLFTLLRVSGYRVLGISNFEDEVRQSVDGFPNILSVIAKRGT